MSELKRYRKTKTQLMRPYILGEDMTDVSVCSEDVLEAGGMIAVNENDPKDIWYVSKDFFLANYELAE